MVRTSSGWKHSLRRSHDQGIVAATGRRVFCLNKGRFSNNVTQIPYRGIQTVSETGPEEVRITRTRLDFGIMNTFEIRPLACAAALFSSLVHSRLLTDAASLEAAFPHVLDSEGH